MSTVINLPGINIPKYTGDPMPEIKPAKDEPITAEAARQWAETVRKDRHNDVLKKALAGCYKMIHQAIDKGYMNTWWPINCPVEYPLPYTKEPTVRDYKGLFEGVRLTLVADGFDVSYEVKYDENILTCVMNISW